MVARILFASLFALLPVFTESREAPTEPPPTAEALHTELDPILEAAIRTYLESRIDYALDDPMDVARKRGLVRRSADAISQALQVGLYEPRHHALDYVRYLNEVSPRLSGNIVRVGPDQQLTDLATAFRTIVAGDLIMLEPGEYDLTRWRTWNALPAITIVGAGRDLTTIKFGRGGVSGRVRLESLTLDCDNDHAVDLDPYDTLHLRDCLVTNYNSGAGGSNAISVTGGMLLVEGCTFDGAEGRQKGRGSYGTAFRWWREDWLFVRHTQFVDNESIHRASGVSVFDGCVSMNQQPTHTPPLYGSCFIRDNGIESDGELTEFTFATDDLVVVEFAAERSDKIDRETRECFEKLGLPRSLPYWIGLIRHQDHRIRVIAADQIERLTGVTVENREALTKRDEGSLRDLGPLFEAEMAYSRLMDWFDINRYALEWDDAAENFRLPEPQIPAIRYDDAGYATPDEAVSAMIAAIRSADWSGALHCVAPKERNGFKAGLFNHFRFVSREAGGQVWFDELLASHGLDEQMLSAWSQKRNELPPEERDPRGLLALVADADAFVIELLSVADNALRAPDGDEATTFRVRSFPAEAGRANVDVRSTLGIWWVEAVPVGERWFAPRRMSRDLGFHRVVSLLRQWR